MNKIQSLPYLFKTLNPLINTPLLNAPIITTTNYEYYNVNKDDRLRYNVVNFFLEKAKSWNFKNKKLLSKDNSYDMMYTLLRIFVKKNKVNWYDLREKNYILVKDFIINKLS